MIITEAALDRLEKAGWVATAGLWTAEGNQVLLRRGTEEQVVTVQPIGFRAGRAYGKLSRKTTLGTAVRRRLANEVDTAMRIYEGGSRVAFMHGLSAGMGNASEADLATGGAR